jgi:cell division septation protein DedD
VGNVPQRTQTQAPAAAAPVANQQVASAAGGAAGAGGYFIQIASQPSAELAQKSYANMAQKYANVIGGRGVDIKRADIPGKGTYYRVRVQAGSRDDANALCGRLKSAGGSCLVTR